GLGQGSQKAEQLIFSLALMNSTDIFHAVWDLLILDDNDHTLANGTPEFAEITAAGRAHNIYPLRGFPNVAQIQGVTNSNTFYPNMTFYKARGTVYPIVGTATAGTVGVPFSSAQLEYGVGIQPTTWTAIGAPITTPVAAGSLLRNWNIQSIPEGHY